MIVIKNRFILPALLLAAILLSGCLSQDGPAPADASGSLSSNDSAAFALANASSDASGKIRVAATIAPLGEFVRAVGGDKVTVTVIVPPAAEPHTFEPTPTQMADLTQADLFVKNGAGLEYWLDRLLQVNEGAIVVDCSQGIELVNESEEEIDPHIWLSLRNAAVQVGNICTGLCQVDPQNREFYINNRNAYLQKLSDLDGQLNRTFAGFQGRIFIVHHPAWTYFAADYNLTQVALMEEEKDPGPRHLVQVISLARQNNITALFVEPQFNPRSAEVIAREMNASIVTVDPLAEDYLENMRYASRQIALSMNGLP